MRTPRLNYNMWLSQTPTIPPGTNGYQGFHFRVERGGKLDHHYRFYIEVQQPHGRKDLDIGFFIVDEMNYRKFINNQPSTALVVAPRVILAELVFEPPSDGSYYVLLDNKYSVATWKDVFIQGTEIWSVEEKAEIIEKAPEKRVVKPLGIVGRLRRFLSRFFRSQSIALTGLFFLIMFLSCLATAAMVYFVNAIFDIEFKDPGIYFAAVTTGGILLFAMIYVLFTGKPWPPITPKPIGA